jgi:hypothetical protein
MESDLSNLIHNEQTKLGAMFLNNCGVAALVGGFVLPFTQPIRSNEAMLTYCFSAFMGFAIAFGFYVAAQVALRRLKLD